MPALLTPNDVALDVTPSAGEPRGFLRARSLGTEPGPAYDRVLSAILESVEAHVAAYGISMGSVKPTHKLAAKHLARYYAAEHVLAGAQTGTARDPEGASMSLSSADLAHWQRARDDALAAAEALLGRLPGPARSAVYFGRLRLKRESDASS